MTDLLRENNYLVFSDESGTTGNERYHANGTAVKAKLRNSE